MLRSALAAFLAISTPVAACDVALVLTVDVSGSVDPEEYRLQMQGIADALADSSVSEALVRAEAKVMLVQWTGDSRQKIVVPWTGTRTFDDVTALSQAVAAAPRAWWQFSTAIGAALAFTMEQFAPVGDCRRKVIDVSGDGSSNEGIAPETLRSALWQAGFTVNGLAIEGSEEDLTGYYWENVIAGENAFVMTADGFADFPETMRLKLLREVTAQLSGLPSRDGAQTWAKASVSKRFSTRRAVGP